MIPKAPIFTIIPDNTADAGAGATGWAVGNQACIGNIPAFTEKPRIIDIAHTRSRVSCPCNIAGSSVPPGVKVKVLVYRHKKKSPNNTIYAPQKE